MSQIIIPLFQVALAVAADVPAQGVPSRAAAAPDASLHPARVLAATRSSAGHADAWSALGDIHLRSGRPQDSARPPPAMAPAEPGDAPRWSLRIGVARSAFDGGRADWNDGEIALRRTFERGSLGLEWIAADRFGRRAGAWALDAYVPLWPRAYANLRYQDGPADAILPDVAYRAEVFQGVGEGYELSASYDRIEFDSGADIYGIGVGRYLGNLYLRYTLRHVPGDEDDGWGHRGLFRNYYAGDGDDYVEASAGFGRSRDLDRFGPVGRGGGASFGVAWMKYFHPAAGFRLAASHDDDNEGSAERRLSAALYLRW